MAELSPAEQHKKEGNSHFANGDYLKAAAAYTKAIKAAPTNHVLYSNRAQVPGCPVRAIRTRPSPRICLRFPRRRPSRAEVRP